MRSARIRHFVRSSRGIVWCAIISWIILSAFAPWVSPYADMRRYAAHIAPLLALAAADAYSATWRVVPAQRRALAVCFVLLTALQGLAAHPTFVNTGTVTMATRSAQDQREALGK